MASEQEQNKTSGTSSLKDKLLPSTFLAGNSQLFWPNGQIPITASIWVGFLVLRE